MNPDLFLGSDYDEEESFEEELMRQSVEHARQKVKEANEAFNELCEVLGLELVGSTIEQGGTKLNIPVSDLQGIVSRIKAMKDSNPLADGVL